MAKRRNENGQMRREDYEAEEDGDRYGSGVTADSFAIGFERASDASIKQRKIVKARVGGRPPVKPAAAPAAAAPAPAAAKGPTAGANPFGGFQGLTASQPAAPSANPFAGFSGLTSASTSATSAAATATTSSVTNGASKAASPGAKTYQEAMEALNKEFLAFVNSQARENPSVSWVAAVQVNGIASARDDAGVVMYSRGMCCLQEYLTYANAIGDKHASTKPVPLEQQNKKAVPAPFSFAPMTGAPLSSSVSTPKSPTNGFFSSSMPSSAAKPKEMPVPAFSASTTSSFPFGSTKKDSETTTTTTSSFSFGATKKDAEPAKETPSKAKDSEAAKPASRFGGFSFGGNSSSASKEKVIPSFSFGAAPVFPPATSSSTASSTTTTSGFSFGSLSSSAVSPSTASTALPPASKPFSFGASAASSSTGVASGADDDEDEENIGREAATVILKVRLLGKNVLMVMDECAND